MAREATQQEVLAFIATPHDELQSAWVQQVIDAAEQTRFWVNDDAGGIFALGVLAELSTAFADPAGWWIAYVWTDPASRDDHYAWEMAEAGIETLAAEGHTFKRGHCLGPDLCGGRCVPYVASSDRSPDGVPYGPGTGGYLPTSRAFRLLDHNHLQGFVLYTVGEVDTEWGTP